MDYTNEQILSAETRGYPKRAEELRNKNLTNIGRRLARVETELRSRDLLDTSGEPLAIFTTTGEPK